ncbi:acyl-coenzyme A thioesterase PaaI-like protein [Rhodococcus sp. LBL1]|nr:acyl-coenzyme A thioesterase PaaI-like protein [Rhodococcus sp. LBL1]MDH6685060.1 acyl-coenzyme A thioesterase PaaI-like protein [Rhodococcus sp. LBL2]
MSANGAVTQRSRSTVGERFAPVGDPIGEEARGYREAVTGSWLADGSGQFCRGALGIVFDDVMGSLAAGHCSDLGRAVATQIHLDFLLDPPLDGSTLRAESWGLHSGTHTVLAGGRIVDATGSLVATGSVSLQTTSAAVDVSTTRGQIVPAATRRGGESIDELIGALRRQNNGRSWVELDAAAVPGDPGGHLSAGILLCASELAGLSALPGEAGFRTNAIHVTYLRPCPSGDHVTFVPTVLHVGRTMALVQVVGRTISGTTCTSAVLTCGTAR